MDATENRAPIRFQVPALPGIWFLRYPASVIPNEGTIGFVTDEKTWQTGAVFEDGAWRSVRAATFKTGSRPKMGGKVIERQITAWTVMEKTDGQG